MMGKSLFIMSTVQPNIGLKVVIQTAKQQLKKLYIKLWKCKRTNCKFLIHV